MTGISRSAWLAHGIGVAMIALVVRAAFEQRHAAQPGVVEVAARESRDRIYYEVSRREWPQDGDPSYCEIARRLSLSRREIVATLQMNGGSDGCADGLDTVPRGRTIPIALEGVAADTCRSANLCS